MTIRAKVIGGFALVIILVSCSALTGLLALRKTNDRLHHLVDISSQRQLLAGRIQQHLLELHRAEKNMILTSTGDEMGEFESEFDHTEVSTATAFNQTQG